MSANIFVSDSPDHPDQELIERLTHCLKKAKIDQAKSPPVYQATGEWNYLLQRAQDHLPNMFREPGHDGIGASYTHKGLGTISPRGLIKSRLIARDMGHDLRIWRSVVGGDLEQLRAPEIGNPWGVIVDGVLLYPGVCRADYFAAHVANLLGGQGSVVEIGGGYGEFAYRLLRRAPDIRYTCFDLPETLIKSSYFLMRAFPEKTFRLYDNLTADGQISLLPNFLLPQMQACDLTINTRSLSEMGRETVNEYVALICRFTRRYFVHENSTQPIPTFGTHFEIPASEFPILGFRKLGSHQSCWSSGGGPNGRYAEYLYERNHDGLIPCDTTDP